MDTVKTCPTCHKDNKLETTVCEFCGTPLMSLLPAVTTEPVPDIPLKITPPDHIVQLTKLYADIVVLVVLGQEQPILLRGGGKTILGRYSPGEVAPSVDLTPYNANLLGVSRQHATITRSEDTFVLEDLGSTNGTWLNEVKLTANKPTTFQSGDLIRLGQLGLYVYFDTSRADKDSDSEFILQKENITDSHLTVRDLSTHLIPYLTALIGIQAVYDTIANRKSKDVTISSLNFDAETGRIKIKLNGATDIYRALQTKIAPWKSKHQKQITLVVEIDKLPIPQTEAIPTPVTPEANGQTNLGNNLRQELEAAERQLADDMVIEVIIDPTEERKKDMADKFIPHIHNLALNTLRFVTSD
jgi:pSer/pThr/pTyr-binding forkhead associated (FHA) protein